jgi:ribosome-associated protein
MLIHINRNLAIDDGEIQETFIQAGGPGGQNVNKLATAAQLRFDARRSPSLPEDVRTRLEELCGRRLTREGVVVITARRRRTQEGNRADALERLLDLIRKAAEPPDPPRRPTRPSRAVKRRRREAKSQRSTRKSERRAVNLAD